MTAKYYKLEMLANDKDMETLAIHYPDWLKKHRFDTP
jgi:hypothetical protein